MGVPRESRILGTIDAEEIVIGQGVLVEEGALITGKNGRAARVVLGDHCCVGRGTRILVPEFCLGDYSKLHAHCFAHGMKPLRIGRNCWIGGGTVLDSMGGLTIDDNVGIGSQSQIWTHIRFGDIVEGCRFFRRSPCGSAKTPGLSATAWSRLSRWGNGAWRLPARSSPATCWKITSTEASRRST